MPIATLTKPLVTPWQHWARINPAKKEKRLFIVVDVPHHELGTVVIMEVKDYQPGEPRIFQTLPYIDWIVMTEEKKQLTPYTPKL